ncbi:MAG: MotA/TolQ/ExbB proton channel family protein [Leptospiraceae bacterium]|nr:MotA/TolQ/ExbB proton channel family protein [Leptospiraceae bacterium]
MSPVELFYRGGIFMWPILGLLIVSVGIGLERMLYFLWTYAAPGEPESFARPHREGNGPPGTLLDRILPDFAGRMGRFPAIRLAKVAVQDFESPSSQDAAILRTGNELTEEMTRRLSALPLVSSVAPMVGLLGTVAGMMVSFQAIAGSGGQADIAALADGIWTAMITTAFGLLTSIPAYLLHGFFLSLVNRRIALMNRTAHYLEENRSSRRTREAAP